MRLGHHFLNEYVEEAFSALGYDKRCVRKNIGAAAEFRQTVHELYPRMPEQDLNELMLKTLFRVS